MVGALGVVEDQPVGQFAVEEGEVGKEQILMVVDKGLLDCSVEAFGVGVHLRGFGVGVPAFDALILEEAGEVGLELTAVVGEDDLRGVRQQGQALFEGAGGVSGVLGGQAHGKGKVRDRIDEGDDVAAHAVADALDGIAGQHLQGLGFDLLGFSGFDVSLQGFSSSAAGQA
jgi:hypothetical protein